METEELSALLAELAHRHGVTGAQLVLHQGNRTVSAVFGEETHGTGRKVTERSAFRLGSLTKPFTATLAMILVADGDVGLDVPLGEYLPEVGPPAAGTDRRMTLRQLLSHTSGLVAAIDEEAAMTAAPRRWVAENCREADLAHPPGTSFSYSNVGYALTGHLVERVTGMDWWEAVDTILLGPLEIDAPFGHASRSATGRPIATGHTVHTATGRVLPVEHLLPAVGAPNGGLALSAGDLVRFARMHLGDPGVAPLLDSLTAQGMRRDELAGLGVGSFGMADGWGLGWASYRDTGTEWFGHDGTSDGNSCHLRFDPAGGTVVALTTNSNTGLAMWESVVTELRAAGIAVGNYPLSALADPAPRVPGPAECAGRYVNGLLEFVIAGDSDGGFHLSLGGEPHSALTFFPGLRFTMRELGGGRMTYVGRFLRDEPTGRIDLIQVTGRLARRYQDSPSGDRRLPAMAGTDRYSRQGPNS
jgi:CubicO group peptidase (beta-lactamase class C family)